MISKFFTSLEALEIISKELESHLLFPKNIREDLINPIKHDLEEYEKYKQQWSSDIHCWVEDKIGNLFVCDDDEGYIVHLYEMEIFNELLANVDKLLYENQNLKVFVNAYANARDELLIKNEQLEEENKELSEAIQLSNEYIAKVERTKVDLINENKKLEKVIKILKGIFDIYAGEGKGYIDCCVENPIITFDLYNDKEFKLYNLLKEVLEDEKN